MNLREYIKSQRGNATALAGKLGISLSQLSQMAADNSQISPIRAVEIEQNTDGHVTRQELRADDWQRIWPELICPPQQAAA